jgi:hypothetical protein
LFPQSFPSKIAYAFPISPMHDSWPTHLNLLYLTALIIPGEVYKLRSSLPDFIQSPIISSFLTYILELFNFATSYKDSCERWKLFKYYLKAKFVHKEPRWLSRYSTGLRARRWGF